MFGHEVGFRDAAAIRFTSDRSSVELRFDGCARGWFGRATEMRLEFEAVKCSGIVTGRDHHATDGLLGFHGKRNGGGRGGPGGGEHNKNNFGGNFRSAL